MVLQPSVPQLSMEDVVVISPGDLVNCFTTMSELGCVRNSTVAAVALDVIKNAVDVSRGGRAVAFIIAVIGSQVHVCVLGAKRVVVSVPKRRIILFKGGMSNRERAVRAAFNEEEP